MRKAHGRKNADRSYPFGVDDMLPLGSDVFGRERIENRL
jgi:hypothetical protein